MYIPIWFSVGFEKTFWQLLLLSNPAAAKENRDPCILYALDIIVIPENHTSIPHCFPQRFSFSMMTASKRRRSVREESDVDSDFEDGAPVSTRLSVKPANIHKTKKC